jgi:U3 small nucleolar RNA-associated protein MPP10
MATQKGRQGVGKTAQEMDQDERKTLRQSKKAAKRSRKRMRDLENKIVSKLKPGLGNKHAKKNVLEGSTDNINWTKSSDVFKRLQSAQENPEQAAASTFNSSKRLNEAASATRKPAASYKL